MTQRRFWSNWNGYKLLIAKDKNIKGEPVWSGNAYFCGMYSGNSMGGTKQKALANLKKSIKKDYPKSVRGAK